MEQLSVVLCVENYFLGQIWTVVGEIPNLPKTVAIISPHTSNIDGWYGFLGNWRLGLKLQFWEKILYLKPPFKSILDWAGLIPVHRDSTNGLTEQNGCDYSQI